MILFILQIIVSALLIGVILLQVQSSGMSSVFGGGGEFYQSRRSIEKLLLYATVVLAAIFGVLSVFLLFLQ